MEKLKEFIGVLLSAVLYICVLVVVLSCTLALALSGIEALYWIVTGTFFHLIPVG